MRRTLLAIGLVVAVLVGIGVYFVLRQPGHPLPVVVGRSCTVRTAAGVVKLSPDQMANAATIAAVGLSRQLPDKAVVIALATALQESELVNLRGGDRDSIGLFQQRPSQGWGTAEQIQDPRYAAAAFYHQLLMVPGWENLRVTEAAQLVQRSAYPEAYDQWVTEAAVLGQALVGDAASAVSCSGLGAPADHGTVAADALASQLELDWGDGVGTARGADGTVLMVQANTDRTGWRFAHWLVSHAGDHGVSGVRFGDQLWTAKSGEWQHVNADPKDAALVIAEVYP
jgi:hypothetical protein